MAGSGTEANRNRSGWTGWSSAIHLLFVSGNHENFDLLAEYPQEDWNGGKVQRIHSHVIHLLRG